MPDENPTPDELRARGFTEEEIAEVERIGAEGVRVPTREAVHLVPPSDPLTVFVRARLDEREARAKAAAVDPAIGSAWTAMRDMVQVASWYLGDDDPFSTFPEPVAAHVADNDPEFVLADVAAKRQIVAACESVLADPETANGYSDGISPVWLARHTLRLLALPFAGHPDYREDFRP